MFYCNTPNLGLNPSLTVLSSLMWRFTTIYVVWASCARAWVKLLTDLQILGCELHKNAFGVCAQPGPAGEAVIRGTGGREGEGKGLRIGTGGRGGKGRT